MPLGERWTKSIGNAPRWLVALAAVVLASLACDDPVTGVTCLIDEPDGSIIAPDTTGAHISTNGGITWTDTTQTDYYSYCTHPYERATWIEPDPKNPSIQYRFEPHVSISRSIDGGVTWTREIDLAGTEARTVYTVQVKNSGFEVMSGPFDAVFHQQSGNVVVSMGYEGALVRLPSGDWGWVEVGRYRREDLTDPTRAIPLLLQELMLAVIVGLVTATSIDVLSKRRGLLIAVACIIVSLVLVPAVVLVLSQSLAAANRDAFEGQSVIEQVILSCVLATLVCLPFIIGVIGSRWVGVANPLRFMWSVAGLTYLIANIMVVTSLRLSIFGSLTLLTIGVDLVLTLIFSIPILISQRHRSMRYRIVTALFGVLGALAFIVCYFLWVLGIFEHYISAAIAAGVLAVLNLLAGCLVMYWRYRVSSSDAPIIPEPAPAETVEPTT